MDCDKVIYTTLSVHLNGLTESLASEKKFARSRKCADVEMDIRLRGIVSCDSYQKRTPDHYAVAAEAVVELQNNEALSRAMAIIVSLGRRRT